MTRRPRRESWPLGLLRLAARIAYLVAVVLVIVLCVKGVEWMSSTAWGSKP